VHVSLSSGFVLLTHCSMQLESRAVWCCPCCFCVCNVRLLKHVDIVFGPVSGHVVCETDHCTEDLNPMMRSKSQCVLKKSMAWRSMFSLLCISCWCITLKLLFVHAFSSTNNTRLLAHCALAKLIDLVFCVPWKRMHLALTFHHQHPWSVYEENTLSKPLRIEF